MTQTETLMVLALGFALALVCVLLFARSVWNIGQRLARRRNEKNKPVLVRDLEAERDQLRASHAVMQQKLDSKLAEARARVAEHQAELSRHRNRVQTLIAEVNVRGSEIDRQAEAIQQLTLQTENQAAELDGREEMIVNLRDSLEAREEDLAVLKAELEKTVTLLDQSKHQLMRLEDERDTAVQQVRQTPQRAIPELQVPQPQVPLEAPRNAARRFDFGIEDDPPKVLQRKPVSELSELLTNVRRNMMEQHHEANAAPPKPRPLAGVISIAQRVRPGKGGK